MCDWVIEYFIEFAILYVLVCMRLVPGVYNMFGLHIQQFLLEKLN